MKRWKAASSASARREAPVISRLLMRRASWTKQGWRPRGEDASGSKEAKCCGSEDEDEEEEDEEESPCTEKRWLWGTGKRGNYHELVFGGRSGRGGLGLGLGLGFGLGGGLRLGLGGGLGLGIGGGRWG